jgi:hypothetical protein
MSNNEEITPNQVRPDGNSYWNGSDWISIPVKKKSKKKPILIGIGIFIAVLVFAGACGSSNTVAPPQGSGNSAPAPAEPTASGSQVWVESGGADRVENLISAAVDGAEAVSTAAGNQDPDGVISAGNQIAAAADGILSESKVCEDPELAAILRDMGTVLRDTGDAAVAAGNGFNNLDIATIESSTARIAANTEKIGPITTRFQEWVANNS